jgi:hypothetical protein
MVIGMIKNLFGLKHILNNLSVFIFRKGETMKGFYIFLLTLTFWVNSSHAQNQNITTEPAVTTVSKYNFVRLYPFAVMDVGVGVGASYERLFGQKKNFGLVLPGFLILEGNANPTSMTEDSKSYDAYFYFAPGFKFYPKGHKKLTYAFGPSLMFGFCNSTFETPGTNSNGEPISATVKYSRKRFGILANNYVTLEFGKYFDIGLEGGLGVSYFDRESYNGPEFYPADPYNNKGVDITGQFSLSIGYKF